MRIRALVAAATAVAAIAVGAPGGPVLAGTDTPVVTVAGQDGNVQTFTDCAGDTQVYTTVPGSFLLSRSGNRALPLTVDLTYGGSLVRGTDYEAPDQFTFDSGVFESGIQVDSETPGTITVTISDGATYDPSPSASSATATIELIQGVADCPSAEAQTIRVGTAPRPIPIYDRLDINTIGYSTLEIEGDVPPGLTFERDGSWTGVATEVGTFSFTASWCEGVRCLYVLPITITVVPAGAGTPAAPAAAPVAGAPTLTG